MFKSAYRRVRLNISLTLHFCLSYELQISSIQILYWKELYQLIEQLDVSVGMIPLDIFISNRLFLDQYYYQMSRKGHFPQDIAKKLLVLEQHFHNKTLALKDINELVATYVQSIQQFDVEEGHLKYYFVQKIQFLLSRPEVIQTLSGNQNVTARQTLNNIRDTMRGTISSPVKFVNPVYDMSKKHNTLSIEQQIKYDQDLKRKQRSIRSQMYMDVERQLKQQAPILKTQFKNQSKAGQKIRGIISNQQQLLQSRINKRKKPERKSVEKVKQQEVHFHQLQDLKQMQHEIHENVARFSVRQSVRIQQQTAVSNQQERRQTIVRQTKKGGRITIRNDDDDD